MLYSFQGLQQARADGHTIGICISPQLVSTPKGFSQPPFNVDDFKPIAAVSNSCSTVLVRSDSSPKSIDRVKELAAKKDTLVDTARIDAEGYIRRIGHVDLMNIDDPDGKAIARIIGKGAAANKFTFPFFTIENVMRVDANRILVANDNNLPFSGGREIGKAANNEFILLDVDQLLAARFSLGGSECGDGFVESFNGRLRDECLDEHLFACLNALFKPKENRAAQTIEPPGAGYPPFSSTVRRKYCRHDRPQIRLR